MSAKVRLVSSLLFNRHGRRLALLVTLAFACSVVVAEKPSSDEQLWLGTLDVGAARLRVLLKATPSDDGWSAKFVSLDQGPGEIDVDTVEIDEKSFRFTVPTIEGEFSGQLNEDGDVARGEWSQLGQKIPLVIRRIEEMPGRPKRPQTPRPPFPYRSIDVSIDNEKDGVTLAGTLTVPNQDGPHPAIVLITGSGPQDRDQTLLRHKPFLVLADHLTRRGIAVLRYDDRGVGKSTGDFSASTTLDFADDVRAAMRFLRLRSEVDFGSIGLLGHSSGALAASLVAAESEDIEFLVMIAGPGIPANEVIRKQATILLEASGTSQKEIERDDALRQALMKAVAESSAGDNPAEILEQGLDSYLAELPKNERAAARPDAATLKQFEAYATPWFRFMLSHDPRPVLRRVSCPVLALYGELDIQVPPEQNLPEVTKSLEARSGCKSKVVELAGLNHLMQTATTGLPNEYAQIEETMSPKALTTISDWILEQVDQ